MDTLAIGNMIHAIKVYWVLHPLANNQSNFYLSRSWIKVVLYGDYEQIVAVAMVI